MDIVYGCVKQVFKVVTAKTYDAEHQAWLDFGNPFVPEMIKITGDKIYPPPFQHKDDISVIFCNHPSDIDQMIVMHKMERHKDKPIQAKLTGFTYESFRFIPAAGMKVGETFLGLRKQEHENDLMKKVQSLLDEGYNTWLLFPEGTLETREKFIKSIKYQIEDEHVPESKVLRHVLYPHIGAMKALCRVAAHRIKNIVDLTLDYHDFDAVHSNDSMLENPRILYACFYGLKPPTLHCRIHHLNDAERVQLSQISQENKGWLIKLWTQKDKLLAKKKERRQRKCQVNKPAIM
jgi:hypothetical protein